MTDDELADDWIKKNSKGIKIEPGSITEVCLEQARISFLAGLEAGRPQWHKVADGDLPKGENIHRDIYLKDRYGNLYTGNYFPKDENHTEDCFAVEFLEWGFQGSQFCMKEQIAEWSEIPEE